jgi:hypothetical protein
MQYCRGRSRANACNPLQRNGQPGTPCGLTAHCPSHTMAVLVPTHTPTPTWTTAWKKPST